MSSSCLHAPANTRQLIEIDTSVPFRSAVLESIGSLVSLAQHPEVPTAGSCYRPYLVVCCAGINVKSGGKHRIFFHALANILRHYAGPAYMNLFLSSLHHAKLRLLALRYGVLVCIASSKIKIMRRSHCPEFQFGNSICSRT